MYRYLTIRANAEYSSNLPQSKICAELASFEEFEKVSPYEYRNKREFPFLVVGLRNADSSGNYAETTDLEKINMVELIGSDDGSEELKIKYQKLGQKIASLLGWHMIEDEK